MALYFKKTCIADVVVDDSIVTNTDDGTNGTDGGTGGTYTDTDAPTIGQSYDFTTTSGLAGFLEDLDNTANLQDSKNIPRAIGRLKLIMDADNYFNHLRPIGTEIKDYLRAAHKKYWLLPVDAQGYGIDTATPIYGNKSAGVYPTIPTGIVGNSVTDLQNLYNDIEPTFKSRQPFFAMRWGDSTISIKDLPLNSGLFKTVQNIVLQGNSVHFGVILPNEPTPLWDETESRKFFEAAINGSSYTVHHFGPGQQLRPMTVNLSHPVLARNVDFYDHTFQVYTAFTDDELELVNEVTAPASFSLTPVYNFYAPQYEQRIQEFDPRLILPMYVIAYGNDQLTQQYDALFTNGQTTVTNTEAAFQLRLLNKYSKQGFFRDYVKEILVKSTSYQDRLIQQSTNIVVPVGDMSIIKNYNDKSVLFPMAMELEFTTDTATIFTDLLQEAKLDDDLLRTLVLTNTLVLTGEGSVRAALGDISPDLPRSVEGVGVGPPGTFNESTILFEQRTDIGGNEGGLLNTYAETKPASPRLTIDLMKWYNAYKNGRVSEILKNRGQFTNTGLFLKEYNDTSPENECDALTRELRSIIFMGKFRQFVEDHFRTWRETMEGKTAYSETLMYRIAKYEGENFEKPIQNIYIANSSNIDMAKYIDTQVRYDTSYTYKIFAYQLVIGNKYNYDFDYMATPPRGIDTFQHSLGNQLLSNGELGIDDTTGAVTLKLDTTFTNSQPAMDLLHELRAYLEGDNPLVVSIIGSSNQGYDAQLTEQGIKGTNSNPRYWTIRLAPETYPPSPVEHSQRGTGLAHTKVIIDIPPDQIPQDPQGNADLNFKVYQITQLTTPGLQTQPADTGMARFPVTPNGKVHARVHNIPSAIITEVEYSPFLTERISDKPPVFPNVDIVPFRGVDNKVLINLDTHAGEYNNVPVILEDGDEILFNRVREAQKKPTPGTRITFKTDDPAARFEVFRLKKHPAQPQDFRGNKIATIDTKGASSASLIDNIEPNTKYYYIFRTIDVHGHISNPTQFPYRVELINNDGAIYSIVETVEYSTESDKNKKATRSLKKYIHIAPAMQQSLIDIQGSGLTNISTANDATTIKLGTANRSIWGEKIKIRFTSKFTGKRFDLNMNFKNVRKVATDPTTTGPSQT